MNRETCFKLAALLLVAAWSAPAADRVFSSAIGGPSQEISYDRETTSRGCPKPSVSGPSGMRGPGLVTESMSPFWRDGNRFSCPILRFNSADVAFNHPTGPLTGSIPDDALQPATVKLENATASVSANGIAHDLEGGDRHGFVAAAAVDINPNRRDRDARRPDECFIFDGFTGSEPATEPLSAAASCTLPDLRIIRD